MGLFSKNKDTQLLERLATKLDESNNEIDLNELKEAFENSDHDAKKASIDNELVEIRASFQTLQLVGVSPRETLQLLTK